MVGYGGNNSNVGDIWSSGAFSFECPLKDLLDSNHYTIEQLLAEDELLQELRGCHPTLISFLSTEESVTKLIQFILQAGQNNTTTTNDSSDPKNDDDDRQHNNNNNNVGENNTLMMNGDHPHTPNDNNNNGTADEDSTNTSKTHEMKKLKKKEPGEWMMNDHIDDDDNSKHPARGSEMLYIRFPYMACEIICCEIPAILDTMVHGRVVVTSNNNNNNDISSIDETKPDEAMSSPPPTTTVPSTEIVTTSDCDDVEVVQSSSSNNNTASSRSSYNAPAPNSSEETVPRSSSNPSTMPTTTTIPGAAATSDEPTTPPVPDYTGTILDYIVSMLYQTPPGALDDYRAGYLDKILTVLFRTKPDEITTFINANGKYRHCNRHRNTISNNEDGDNNANDHDAVGGEDVNNNESLMHALLKHLYSHSIMEIAKRLLLPQKPMGKIASSASCGGDNNNNDSDIMSEGDDNIIGDGLLIAGGDDANEGKVQCDWSNSSEGLDMLLDILIGDQYDYFEEEQKLELSLNASEVITTIIQNSMLSSNTMLSLTQSDTVLRIVTAATVFRSNDECFSPHESMLTSAMNVLESLIYQLGGYGAVGTMTLLPSDTNDTTNDPNNHNDPMIDLSDPTNTQRNNYNIDEDLFKGDSDDDDDPQNNNVLKNEKQSSASKLASKNDNNDSDPQEPQQQGDEATFVDDDGDDDDRQLIADLGSILEHLPFLLDNLSKLLHHPSTKTWKSPMQYSENNIDDQPMEQQLLGNSRLRIVRVLESLVLLGDPDVDAILVAQSDCLEVCLHFFWQFQWCSMLHQSVANLLVHVFEGQNTRYEMQEFFLHKCDLLNRLMNSFLTNGGIEGESVIHNLLVKGTGNNSTSDVNLMITGTATNSNDDAGINSNNNNTDTHLVPPQPDMPPQPPPPIEGMIVENLNDLNEEVQEGNPTNVELLAAALLESGDISKGTTNSSSTNATDPLPISEDDVDAVMEDDDNNLNYVEQLSTDAVRFESRECSIVGGGGAIPLAQSFRYGYMGHVIIICNALVNAYMHDDEGMNMHEQHHDQQMKQLHRQVDDAGMGDNHPSHEQHGDANTKIEGVVSEEEAYTGPKDDFGDPLLLAELVNQHTVAERWHEFVATTLASENAIQSTPLGGYNMHNSGGVVMLDPIHSHHRPGLIDEGYMMGDDGEGPPAPPSRSMLVGGDVIDMDDNDLDIAANMVAGLTLARGNNARRRGSGNRIAHNDLAADDNEDSGSFGSGDSERSYNSGETANERSGYAFDDPLGNAGGLGIELGKLTQYDHKVAAKLSSSSSKRGVTRSNNPTPEDQTEDADDDNNSNSSHSSSSDDDEHDKTHERNDSEEVPVIDLFAGNFNFTSSDESSAPIGEIAQLTDFADFANFDQVVVMSAAEIAPSDASAFVGMTRKSNTEDIDDDFGPFAGSDHRKQPPTSSSDFGNFEAVDVVAQEDPFHMEPMQPSEFEEIFGKEKDHLSLLEQDGDPIDVGASSSSVEFSGTAKSDEPNGCKEKSDAVSDETAEIAPTVDEIAGSTSAPDAIVIENIDSANKNEAVEEAGSSL